MSERTDWEHRAEAAHSRESAADGTSSGAKSVLAEASPWLAVWGAVCVFRALADFGSQWIDLNILKQIATWGAGGASLAGLLVSLLRGPVSAKAGLLRAVLPVIAVLASVALLDYAHAITAFFVPMFHALVLSVVFLFAGASGIRGMLALGLWLFAAALVLGVWYLGYAPLVLEGMSGLALLAAALLLQWEQQQGGRNKA